MQYHEACYAVAVGDIPAALALLRKAVVEQDFSGAEALRRDRNFSALHGDPEFEAILHAISSAPAEDSGLGQLTRDQLRE